jgi:glucokinase
MYAVLQTYPTSQYDTFETCMADFLDEPEVKPHKQSIKAGALAVAGAVTENRCRMTNIDWVIDGTSLEQTLGFK